MYTYKIEYERFVKKFGYWARAGFGTTDDAVNLHLAKLYKAKDVRQIRVVKL